MLAGTWSLDDFSRTSTLDDVVEELDARDYRRWAFESAALDLALRQAELGRSARRSGGSSVPSASSSRRAPTSQRWLEVEPELEFKLDAEKDWDRELLRGLRELDRVRVVDLKAYYRGTAVDLAPDPELYRAVAEELPDVVIEDAWLEDGLPRGARRRRGAAELRRSRPLARRPRRAAARAALAERQAVAFRDGA